MGNKVEYIQEKKKLLSPEEASDVDFSETEIIRNDLEKQKIVIRDDMLIAMGRVYTKEEWEERRMIKIFLCTIGGLLKWELF